MNFQVMSRATEDMLDKLQELCGGRVDLYEALRACSDRKGNVKLEALVAYIVKRRAALRGVAGT